MIKSIEIRVIPSQLYDEEIIRKKIITKLGKSGKNDFTSVLKKRSIDARQKQVLFLLRYDVYIDEIPVVEPSWIGEIPAIPKKKNIVIIGAGPAGYFAALQLLALGLKPIVLDRGKDVRERRRDLKAIQQDGIVNPHSNYCFGEGGAGTYSDGKLYTRSYKRGKIKDVLQILVEHGASTDILIDAHPHIGSNKLPNIIGNIRQTILENGGEVHFHTFVTDININNNKITGVIDELGKEYPADAVILATGHSARDIYYLLDKKGITIEKKPFALGIRIEHPQSLIDSIQYGQREREENLPASSYSMACQVNDKGVFSFCMCPGGLIVPAATAPGEIVVNGMSLSRRDSPYSNSGFVTAIDIKETESKGYEGIFGHLDLQHEIEKKAFDYGDGSQKAPAQKVVDFVKGRVSDSLNPCSYIPGIYSAPLHEILPDFIYKRLSRALIVFGSKMKGYYSQEGQLVGIESRTSSPIRVPRNKETLMHEEVEAFFPCGEGAGYAGGILSAAMDGQNVALAVSKYLN